MFTTWPWFLFPLAIIIWPVWFVLSLVLFPLRMLHHRSKVDRYFAGEAYEQYRRCPACGSDQVETVSSEGFSPTAAFSARLGQPVAPARVVQVSCPSCRTQNRVALPAKKAKCGKCKTVFLVLAA